MEAKYLNHIYWSEEKKEIQGKEFELEYARKKLREEGFIYSYGNNGSEIWKKEVRGYVFFSYEGKKYMSNIVNKVIDFYGLQYLSEFRFNSFCKDWENGKVNIIYDEEKDELVILNA